MVASPVHAWSVRYSPHSSAGRPTNRRTVIDAVRSRTPRSRRSLRRRFVSASGLHRQPVVCRQPGARPFRRPTMPHLWRMDSGRPLFWAHFPHARHPVERYGDIDRRDGSCTTIRYATVNARVVVRLTVAGRSRMLPSVPLDPTSGTVLQGPARRPLAPIPLTLGSDDRLYRA